MVGEPSKNKRAGAAGSAGAATAELQKATRSRMQDLARLVGNDEIVKRIEQGAATREQMLAFVAQQLGEIRDLQTKELDLLGAGGSGPAWTRLATSNAQMPVPERWQGPARAYEAAVAALCRGDLKRGQELLEQAIAVQEQVAEETTDLVGETERDPRGDATAFAAMVAAAPTTGACPIPLPIRDLLGAILGVVADPREAPDVERILAPAWAEEEEEDDEDDEDEGK